MSEYLKPVKISETAWYYENKEDIDVVVEHRDLFGKYLGTTIIGIPWRKLKRSIKRRFTKSN